MVANSAPGFDLRYCWLNQLVLSKSNLAPALPTLSKEKESTNSCMLNNSWGVPGFQPKKTNIFVNASGKYPSSL